jgi:hypothetical protein
MVTLQRQLSLDPEAVPEPPAAERAARAASDGARALWPALLRLGAVAGVAAVAAWGIVLLPGPKKSSAIVLAQGPVQEPVQAPVDVPPEPATNRVKLVHVEFATMTPTLSPEKFVATSEPVSTDPSTAVAPSDPAPQPVSSPPDNQEIAVLVKRGKDFLINGDIASARLLLKHAAEAGSADAALALGATFDPLVIARLGAVGAASDIAQAREWYEKAAARGSPAASQSLAKLTPASP